MTIGQPASANAAIGALAAAGHRARRDDWLAERIGRAALRLTGVANGPQAAASLAAALAKGVFFADAKIGTSDVASAGILADAGFRVVDTLMTFGGDISISVGAAPGFTVRLARSEDRADVEHVAEASFRYSRFHLDPRVPDPVAHRIKRDWAANFFAGRRGDAMIVAADEDGVRGFLLLVTPAQAPAVIDLIAVAPDRQARGLGRAMVLAARDAYGKRGFIVGTQAANIPSLRFYQSLGLRSRDTQYVFHFHGGTR